MDFIPVLRLTVLSTIAMQVLTVVLLTLVRFSRVRRWQVTWELLELPFRT